jgi:type IV secretion system protein VirB10
MRLLGILITAALSATAQSQPAAAGSPQTDPTAEQREGDGWRRLDAPAPVHHEDVKTFTVQPGTKIPLSMINSVSTKHAAEGDRVYLETVFPILVDGRMVIPPGSYVAGTITESKRPGRVKGRGELYVRFDSLTLPNGVTREFRSRIGSLDGRASEELDREEGKVKGEGNKTGDLGTVAGTTATGTMVGGLAGRGMGAGIGAAAGATAGLVAVLLSRGPDAVLAKGTTLEMVLDRPLTYEGAEIEFGHQSFRRNVGDGSGPLPSRKATSRSRLPGVGWPY